MKIKHQAIAALACGVLLAPAVHAQGDPGAYWTNPDGEPYKNADGECWKKPDWTEADATMECDPDLVPKPEPKPEPKPAPPPPPPEPTVERINLGADTNFAFDSAQLTAEGIKTVESLAQRLKQVDPKTLSINIAGHTDSVGSEEYNQKLSMERAMSVKKEFVEEGINPDAIITQGYGETVPLASNSNPEGRAQNRRVDITIRATKIVPPSGQ
jgi:OmpA-OmpF porin, OOP family